MERLTGRGYTGKAILKRKNLCGLSTDLACYDSKEALDLLQKAFDKLAEYEDTEEQGLLPKFHLGDEFWTMWLGKPLKAKIVMLQQKKNGIWKYRFCDEQSHTHDYEENEFGKYFWTTKEEAERAISKT